MTGYVAKPPFPILDPGDPINIDTSGCWVMGEGSGTKIRDISRFSNDGDVQAAIPAVTWESGAFGAHVGFPDGDSGNAARIVMPRLPNYTAAPLTATLAWRVSSLDSTFLLEMDDPVDWAWVVWLDTDFRHRVDIRNSGGVTSKILGTIITTDTWYVSLLTFDAAANAELFLNAASEGTDSPGSLFSGSGDLKIGSKSMHGAVSLLRMWDRVLSRSEIALLASNPFAGIVGRRSQLRRNRAVMV